jgi:hypothetical protein
MKRGLLLGIVLTMLLFLIPATSQALLIGFDPASQVVQVGESVDVALFISGLGDGVVPSLGVFDLHVSFDPTILAFDGATFGDPVLGDQLNLFLGSLTILDDSVPGVVNLFELSFDFPSNLVDFQAPSFTLATLTFDTLAVGTSSLDILDPDPLGGVVSWLGDKWGDPLTFDRQSGSIAAVPEPATLLLIGTGLIGLGYFRGKSLIGS